MTPAPDLLGPLDRLADRAETLAGAWAARARNSTTIGRERANLRLFGVGGLDAAGKPLAWSALERYLGPRHGRLGGGIILPFAMALVEYDLQPQRLALDVASGAVDLAMEAELLRESDRRALAEEEASRLATAAFERIDANRTARHELLSVLGDPTRPWIGATIADPEIEEALQSTREALEAGADVVEVVIPIGRELTDRLRDAGLEAPVWRPRDSDLHSDDTTHAPTGSQRALGSLRRHLDEIAAQRRNYVRMAAIPPPLGAPESAVVAAFERVDLAEADPMAEIIDGHVAPERALADHAFAHAMLARAGVIVTLSAGSLVVAPDLARGIPSDPPTRAGRALALQALSVAIARGNGVPDDQLLIGALPAWIVGEPQPAARAAAEVAVRRALYPTLSLSFVEPVVEARRSSIEMWPAIVAAIAPSGPAGTLVLRRSAPDAASAIRSSRMAAVVAAELDRAFASRPLEGMALEHAQATVAAAVATLERLADDGWRSVLGDQAGRQDDVRIGADSVAERTESFDPFDDRLATIG
ncbi:MAG TPA: lysine 5,6-aminomutase subunit alpha [Candidatus Limnocylindrales bacterium]|nr:lysine 5,6-aminomutase subunit alpha [Candidatus Limnocylindrales bacterium]